MLPGRGDLYLLLAIANCQCLLPLFYTAQDLFIIMLVSIQVDLLEPVSHFLDTARRNLAPENLMVTEDYKAVNFFCVPLQVKYAHYHGIYVFLFVCFTYIFFLLNCPVGLV